MDIIEPLPLAKRLPVLPYDIQKARKERLVADAQKADREDSDCMDLANRGK